MDFLDDIKKEKIRRFAFFVKSELKIKNNPTIIIKSNRDGLKTTGSYNYGQKEKIITVYGKNRMLVDIFRTLAHEMVHHKQYEDNRLLNKPKDIGGEIEDEANALAGRYIKMYAKIDSTIYDE